MTDSQITRRAALAGIAALAAAPAMAQDALAAKGYVVGDAPMGAADAPVTVIEYASLTCPHCAAFHVKSFGAVKAEWIDTGKVRFIMREIYFDQFGLWGTMLARCAGADNYHKMIDMLLTNQNAWFQSQIPGYNATKNPKPMIEAMMVYGKRLGISKQRMEDCLQDQALLERLVSDFQTYTKADDVKSTPTFIINGEKATGAMSPDQFGELVRKHL